MIPNILKLLFQLFLLYMLYKLVFEFIIPVYRASKRMKQDISQMQQKMQEQQQYNNPNGRRQDGFVEPKSKPATDKTSSKDYIEFEEIK